MCVVVEIKTWLITLQHLAGYTLSGHFPNIINNVLLIVLILLCMSTIIIKTNYSRSIYVLQLVTILDSVFIVAPQ